MRNRFAKFLSIFLVIAMLAGALPVRKAVFAAEEETAAETATETATETEAKKDDGDSAKTSEKEPEKSNEPAPSSEPADEEPSEQTTKPSEETSEQPAEVPGESVKTSARNDGTVITSVSATVTAPSVGATASFKASIPSGVGYYIDEETGYAHEGYNKTVFWYDLSVGAAVEENGVFKAGHQYEVYVYLTAKDGYTFDFSNVKATLNGKTAGTARMAFDRIRIDYDFPTLGGTVTDIINSVEVTLDAPVVGNAPDFDAVFPSGANYYSAAYNGGSIKNDIYWLDATSQSYLNPTSGLFTAGRQYKVFVALTAKNGYTFSQNSITAKLNGQTAEIYDNDADKIVITYTFPKLETNTAKKITSVSITLDAPSNGASPDYTASFPSGVNYYAQDNAVIWKDASSGATLSGKFVGGHQYKVEVYLTPSTNYYFDYSTTATINGQTAGRTMDGSRLKVYYTFEALQATAISSTSITLDAPANGGTPDYTATFPSGANYASTSNNSGNYRNGIRWYDVTSSAEVNATSGKFQAGHQYRVEAYLTAKDGYAFNSSTTAKVNNATATAALDNGQLKVTYTFTALAKIAISAAAVTVDAPSNGAAPDYTATLASGATYVSTSNNSGNYRNGVKWFDVTANADVNPTSGTFQPGHQYRVEVCLTAKDGYTFTASTTATVNNAAATAAFDNGQLKVTYTFAGLPVPTVYANVYCYNETDGVKITDGNVYVAQNNGTQLPAGANQIKISANSNESFTLTAGVTGGGYEFSGWYSGECGSSSAALISRNATITVKISADANYFAAFKKYTIINSLTFAADKVPTVGKTVQQCMPKVTVAETGVTVSSVTLKNTSGTQLASTYSFSKGEKVVLSVVYSVNSAYKLASDIVNYTTLNGNRPSTHDTSKKTLTYTFTASGYINISGIEVSGIADKTYTGEAVTQAPVVTYNGKTLSEGTDYKVGYANNVEAGTATVVISGTGNYGGAKTVTFEILQASNTVTVKGRTVKVKYKKLRKKAQKVSRSKVINVSNAQGKVTYKLLTVKRGKSSKFKKYFKINGSNGIVTVKKKLKKGTYTIRCSVTASGNDQYTKATKTVTFKIKVK